MHVDLSTQTFDATPWLFSAAAQWYPLLGKAGVADKPRGELCLAVEWVYVANPVPEAAKVRAAYVSCTDTRSHPTSRMVLTQCPWYNVL